MRLVAAGRTWTCTGCTVVAGYAEGREAPWERRADALLCLRCARARAVATALHEAGVDAFDTGASKVGARALVAFEMQRDPSQTAADLARAAGVSSVTAGKLRRALEAEHPSDRDGAGGGP